MTSGKRGNDYEGLLDDDMLRPGDGARGAGKLGRFRPERPLPGTWVGLLALAIDGVSMAVHETVGPIPAIVLAVVGIHVGKRGLDSKGRGFALAAIVLALAFLLFFIARMIAGDPEVPPPS